MAVVVFYAYFCYHATMKSQEKRRVFLAINPPTLVKTAIFEHFSRIPELPVSWSFVPTKNFHITLVFLGNVNVSQLSSLSESLIKIFANTPQFIVQLGDIKIYTQSQSLVVYWEVLPSRELLELQSRLKKHCQNIGFFIPERKYYPHITLGRQREKGAVVNQNELVDLQAKSFFRPLPISWQAETAELMDSTFTHFGRRYSCRRQYKFSKK